MREAHTRNKYYTILILEGPDGVGKTTLAKEFVKRVSDFTSWRAVYLSPSQTKTGQRLIKDYLYNLEANMEEERILWLKTMEEVVPQIKQDMNQTKQSTIYVIDRWTLSTAVYQNKDLSELPNYFEDFDSQAIHGLMLQLDERILDERLAERQALDKYEDKDVQQYIRGRYKQYANIKPYKLFPVHADTNENVTRLFKYVINNAMNTEAPTEPFLFDDEDA